MELASRYEAAYAPARHALGRVVSTVYCLLYSSSEKHRERRNNNNNNCCWVVWMSTATMSSNNNNNNSNNTDDGRRKKKNTIRPDDGPEFRWVITVVVIHPSVFCTKPCIVRWCRRTDHRATSNNKHSVYYNRSIENEMISTPNSNNNNKPEGETKSAFPFKNCSAALEFLSVRNEKPGFDLVLLSLSLFGFWWYIHLYIQTQTIHTCIHTLELLFVDERERLLDIDWLIRVPYATSRCCSSVRSLKRVCDVSVHSPYTLYYQQQHALTTHFPFFITHL